MNPVFVITQSPELARSISRYFRYAHCTESFVMRPSTESGGPQHLVMHRFQRIADWVESSGRGEHGIVLRNALVFIDLFDEKLNSFDELDPLALNKGNWSATVAMLLLAFPEMHWVFNTPYKTPDNPLFKSAHLLGEGNFISKIMELRASEYTPIFDPAGLRLGIRRTLSKTKESHYVPLRYHVAAAIDEEDDYAYFNGYMAYRLGFRCHVISTFTMMSEILERTANSELSNETNEQNAQDSEEDEHLTLIFEDLYLNFPDHRDPELHLSNLRQRSETFEALDDQHFRTQFRAFVTVGHDITEDKNLVNENKDFKEEWEGKSGNRKVGDVLKPVSGFFHLWEESGFLQWSEGLSWKGYAGGYVWPPLSDDRPPHSKHTSSPAATSAGGNGAEQNSQKTLPVVSPAGGRDGAQHSNNTPTPITTSLATLFGRQSEPPPVDTSPRSTFYTGHSAPGRLLEIAERLLYRTELNSEHVHTVPEAVYGATLALEAQEYLGHRTPTTSLQALALKHKFEVNAECLFYGVAQNKEVKKRFSEIEREIDSIGRWLNPETRKAAQMDAEMSIVSKLMLVFRQNYQFDEEQECLKRLRNVNRRLWSRKRRVIRTKQIKSWKSVHLVLLGLLGWLFHWPVRAGRSYVEQLVNSVALFCGAIVGWVLVFSFLYGYLCRCTAELSDRTVPSVSRFNSSESMFIPAVQKFIYYAEQGLMHSVTAFFGLQPPHPVETFEQYGVLPLLVTLVAIGLGFVHLGIFISHVYSVISRR